MVVGDLGWKPLECVGDALRSKSCNIDKTRERGRCTIHRRHGATKDRMKFVKIGFKVKNSRKLLDVPYCHIATEAINEELTVVRATRRQDAFEGNLKKPKKGATLLFRDVNEDVVTDNTQYVTTTVAGLTFRFMAGNFFQNNPFMLPVMVDHVVVAAATTVSGNNDNNKMTHLIDCYCGSGLFSLSTAASFDGCAGIEVNEKSN